MCLGLHARARNVVLWEAHTDVPKIAIQCHSEVKTGLFWIFYTVPMGPLSSVPGPRRQCHKRPYFGVIVLCSFFYTLNIVPNITLKLHKISTRNLVGNSISFRCAMHKHRNSVCQVCLLLLFVYFNTLNFVGDITLKLQEISTLLYIDWSHWVEGQCTRTELCLAYFWSYCPLFILHTYA